MGCVGGRLTPDPAPCHHFDTAPPVCHRQTCARTPVTLVDTAIAGRILGLREAAARRAVARVAARAGRAVAVATGRRPRRAVSVEDFAAAYGLSVADVLAAAGAF